jgi:hypothetical protein
MTALIKEGALMKSFCRGVALAVLMFAIVLPASAGSISGSYDATISNVKTKSTALGSFSFNTATDKLTGTLSFNGAFSGTENINQTVGCLFGLCDLGLTGSVNGNSFTYQLLLNLNSDTFSAVGSVWNWNSKGNFGASGSSGSTAVPEGGSTLSYLGLAGLIIFGGIWFAQLRTTQFQS